MLEHTFDHVDYISLHTYYGNKSDNLAGYLAKSLDMDRYIETIIGVCDFVAAKKRSRKRIDITFDEWNVWHHTREQDETETLNRPWQVAPHLAEEPYNLECARRRHDVALAAALRRPRRIACLAQLVNVLAPISTVTGGGAWRQTIYWPFLHASRYGRGVALDVAFRPTYATEEHDAVPWSCHRVDDATETATIFAVNRAGGPVALSGDSASWRMPRGEHLVLEHPTPGPQHHRRLTVSPHDRGDATLDTGTLDATLPKLSWNIIRLTRKRD